MKRQDFFRVCLFLLIFLLLNRMFSDWFLAWTRESSGYQITVQQFETVQDQVSVVVLGDSHAGWSMMAGEIDGAYNFSSPGESYILTYYKIRYYLERGNFHPQVAIVPIDLHLFSSFRVSKIQSQDPVFWGRYVSYVDYGRETGTSIQMIPIITKAVFGILGGINETVKQLSSPGQENSDMLIAGYMPVPEDFSTLSREEQVEQAKGDAEAHFKKDTYLDGVMLDYFYRLLDLLESHDVQVVFVWYPVTDLYYDFVSEYVPVELHISTIEGLLADRQPVLILDYHDFLSGQYEYFYDSTHLNMAGAPIFTQVLIEDLTEAGVLPVTSVGN